MYKFLRRTNFNHFTQLTQCKFFNVSHLSVPPNFNAALLHRLFHKNWPGTVINASEFSHLQIEPAIKEFDAQAPEVLLQELAHNPKFPPAKRLEYFNQVWSLMLQNATILEEKHFILKLECYLRLKHKVSPKDFKRETMEAGVELSEALLKLLLAVVAEHGDPGYVSTVVTSMKSRNFTADDAVFASLIIAHAVRGDMASSRHVIQTMKECRVEPGELTYGAVMRAAIMAGDYSALHIAKATAEQNGLLSTQSILLVLDTIVRYDKLHLLPSVESSIKKCPASEILTVAVSLVFSGFAPGGYLVFKQIPDLSAEQYSNFIRTLFSASIPVSKIVSVCGEMVADGAYDRALFDVLECVLKEKNIPESMKVLQACKNRGLELRQHYFWPLIASVAQAEGEQGVYSILEKMTSMDCPPDSETLAEMVLSRISIDDPESVLQRLREITGQPLKQILAPFLSHIVRSGMISQALQICKRYEESLPKTINDAFLRALATGYTSSGDHSSTVKLLKVFHVDDVTDWLAIVLTGRKSLPASELLILLKALKKEGCFITATGHRWLYSTLSKSRMLSADIDTALRELALENKEFTGEGATLQSFIPHPEEMTLENLECHQVELEAKGMNVRGNLRRLLMASCREGDAVKARKFYKQLIEGGMAESPGILSSLMVAYIKSAMPDDALDVLKRLEKEFPKFSVDCYKIMDLAALLVKNDRLEEAVTLLQDRPQGHSTLKAKSSWERNAWELLTAAAAHGVPAVQKIFEILINCNYSAPTNVVCGPLVKVYLKQNNVKGAVEMFKLLADRHRITPLQQELMQAVINSDNTQLLNSLVQTTARVHGMPSTQATLILALAHHGDSSILRQYLMKDQLNIGSAHLRNQMERAMEQGHVDALKTLLRAGLDVQSIDTKLLISLILKHYSKKGDSEGALTFWKELEELGVNIADEHKANLSALVAATAKT